jgi:hypothetical protein
VTRRRSSDKGSRQSGSQDKRWVDRGSRMKSREGRMKSRDLERSKCDAWRDVAWRDVAWRDVAWRPRLRLLAAFLFSLSLFLGQLCPVTDSGQSQTLSSHRLRSVKNHLPFGKRGIRPGVSKTEDSCRPPALRAATSETAVGHGGPQQYYKEFMDTP